MKNKLYIFFLFLSLFGGTLSLSAQELTEYQLLAPIPLNGGEGGVTQKTTAAQFIPGLFKLTIMLATGLAVLFIIWGGVQYMSTDAFTGKESAKETIWNAIMGLLLALSAWLIIATINPNLMNFDLRIERIPTPVDTNLPSGSTGGGGVSTSGLQQNTENAIAGLRAECSNCTIRITSTTGDSHTTNSLHYQGLAVDIGSDPGLTRFLTGQTTNPRACATYAKILNGVTARFKWEPAGATCGGTVPSTGDHWHMSIIQ